MRHSFKTTTLIAAIGMIVYTMYTTTRYIIHVVNPTFYHFELWEDIRTRLAFDILPLSLIIACIALFKQRPIMSASRPFRIFTIGLFVAFVGTMIFSLPVTLYINGVPCIYPTFYWRVVMLIAGIVWLFMLRKQPTEEASPRSYQVTLIITMLILVLPIVLEMTSGLSLLVNGNILCLNSSAIKSWVRWTAPILPLIHFVFPSIQRINYTRNSHCTPGSFEERTFKRNRIITLILVGITIVAIAIMLVCSYYMHGRHLLQHHPYDLYADSFKFFKTTLCICALVLLVTLPASWFMLSFMAFRQLPNPRGYMIYNISCHVIAWTCLIISCVLTWKLEPMANTFAMIALLTFCAFYATQTIRVISYSLPNGVHVGSYWVPFVSSDYPIPPRREPVIDLPLKPATSTTEEPSAVAHQGNINEIIEANKDKLAGNSSAQDKNNS